MSAPLHGPRVLGLRKNRKAADALVRPDLSPLGSAISCARSRPKACPMIRHLRRINAPLFEDVKAPPRRAVPPPPPAFRRKL